MAVKSMAIKSYNEISLMILNCILFNILFLIKLEPINLILSIIILGYFFIILGQKISLILSFFKSSKYLVSYILGFSFFSLITILLALIKQFNRTSILLSVNLLFILVILSEFFIIIKERRDNVTPLFNPFFKKVDLGSIKNFLFKNKLLLFIFTIQIIYRLILLFLGSEIGIDSFRINYLAFVLIRDQSPTFAPNIVSLLRLDNYSEFILPITQIASLSVLTNLSIENSILLNDIFLSFIGVSSFWLFCDEILKINEKLLALSTLLYSFSPLYLKFTDWTISGRSLFLSFLPFAIFTCEILIRQRKIKGISELLVLNILIFILLIFSHRLMLIYPIYLIIRLFTELVFKFVPKLEQRKQFIFLIFINGFISIIAIILFFLPIIFSIYGENFLIYSWFKDFTSEILYFDTSANYSNFLNGLITWTNFCVLFIMRMGIVFPLGVFMSFYFFTDQFSVCFSKKTMIIKTYFTVKICCLILYPVLYRGPYIYQMLFFFLTLMSVFSIKLFYSWIRKIRTKILERNLIDPSIYKHTLKMQHLLAICLVVFITVPSTYIELYRYNYFIFDANDFDVQYLTTELRELVDFISENFENETFILDSSYFSPFPLQLAALSPSNYFLPTSTVLYSSYGLIDLNQKPIANKIEKFSDIYLVLFEPFSYNNTPNFVEINRIGWYSINSPELPLLLEKYQISYAILNNETHYGKMFSQLYDRGEFIYKNDVFQIVDLQFLLNSTILLSA